MELTPQSARSSTSPYHYTSASEPVYEYPSPAQSVSRYRSTESLQGLGLYSCQMSGSATVDSSTVPHLNSSAATNWPTPSLQQRRTPPSSTQNIPSAGYDAFAPFHPAVSSYSHDLYGSRPAEVSVLPASPLSSSTTSQRSSFSSAPGSEIFTQVDSVRSHTPRIKMEDFNEYAPGNDSMTYGSPQPAYSLLGPPTSSFPGSLEGAYYQEQSSLSWPKVEYASSSELNPAYSSQGYESRSGNEDQAPRGGNQAARRGASTVARTRQPRKLTTKEDANFQCQIKGCGKLFGRSYNYKAHMETHDASREYPFPCPMKDCNKKFVRKTDLQRHHQSVHMKQRNHRCDYCSRYFARKDTLRRHMEDGCSKRFDIETVDFRPQDYSNGEQSAGKVTSRPMENQSRHASYSSSHYSPLPLPSNHGPYDSNHGPYDAPLTSAAQGNYYENSSRPEYVTGDGGQNNGWTA